MEANPIPERSHEWPVQRLRFSIICNPIRSELADRPEDDLVSFVPMEAVGEFGELDASLERQLADVYKGYTYFAEGDVVVAKITPCFENGKGAIAMGLCNGVGFGTTELHVLRAGSNISNRWLYYLTATDPFRRIGESEMLGAGGQKRVPEEFIKDFRVGVPEFEVQEQIADFLDWKIGQIDALIAKKRELIEKLKEKRLAVITQAVTNGMDARELRDADVSWLGKIPIGWSVMRLKFLANIRYGLGEPPEYVDDGLNLVRATDVCQGKIASYGFKMVHPEDVPPSRDALLREGEIVVVRSGAYTGDSAIVTERVAGSVAGFDMVVSTFGVQPEFLAWALLSPYLLEAQIYQARLRAAQPHLNSQDLGSFLVVVPPDGVEEIVDYINHQVGQIEKMIEKVECAIGKLQEYRSALITSAVTGKIDVYKLAIPAIA